MKQGIPINPAMLKWARESAGYTLIEELHRNKKHEEWENGVRYPTYCQLKNLSKRYKRPIAMFFFPKPPE